ASSSSPPRRAEANAYARLERPEPGGPVTSQEWVMPGSPARAAAAAARKTAMASAWPVRPSHTFMGIRIGARADASAVGRAPVSVQQRRDAGADRGFELVDGEGRVEHDEPRGLGLGEFEVGAAHPLVEVA